ncbi:copper resistance CopC/CopD family protein [Geodermatophilus sp. SYSU D00815]
MTRRAALLLLTLLGGWLVAGVALAGPAAAHAEFVSSDPESGARLDEAPAEVTLTFTEGISVGAGYARVLDAENARVDTGAPSVAGAVLTVPLRDGLPEGGYLVTYRIISADSHPVSGAFSFVVGDGELIAAGAGDTGAATDPGVAAALPVARWLGFAGISLAVGVPVLVLACWPRGWASVRLRRLAEWGAGAVAVGALASFALQGPYAAGAGLGAVLDPALLGTTAGTGFGVVLVVRALLALYLLAALARAWRRGTPPTGWSLTAAAAAALGLVVTTAAVGHPVAGAWPGLALPVTAVHVAAMAVWLGGLTGLLAGVLRPGVPAEELAGALPTFSRLAFGSVVALVVTGIVQSVREVGSPAALVETTYGWLLVAKLLVVAVILAAAGVSRVWVQQHLGVDGPRPGGRRRVTAHAFAAESPDVADAVAVRARTRAGAAADALPPFRRSVLVELALAVVVLGVTSVLVGTPPAAQALARPVDVTLPLQGAAGAEGTVQVSVDPARPGPNTLHVYLFDDEGQLAQPASISVALTESAQQIGPLDVELEPAGPGHYVGDGMDVPTEGTWTLTVTVRLDEFTARTASTDFPVR